MKYEKQRLMEWKPGAPDFSRDDMILAVGLQCRRQRFPIQDVLQWLGPPAKSLGDASGGYLVYFYSHDFWGAPKFEVTGGRVIDFGVISIHEPNCKRMDPCTGSEVAFNFLDEMEPFNAAAFR